MIEKKLQEIAQNLFVVALTPFMQRVALPKVQYLRIEDFEKLQNQDSEENQDLQENQDSEEKL